MSKFAKSALAVVTIVLAAGPMCTSARADLPLSRCSAMIQFEPYLGDKCQTLKGGVFTLVLDSRTLAKGWRSEQTGLIWFEGITRGLTQYDAEKLCATQPAKRLASAEDFVEAEIAGIRELFPEMRNLAVWTGTVPASDPSQAYYFAGSEGVIGFFARSSKEENSAAICVSSVR
jgi:hypothetical protein